MKNLDGAKDTKAVRKGKKSDAKKPVHKLTAAKKQKQKIFIASFIKHRCMVTSTCEDCGIAVKTYYEWMKDEEFADAINDAIERLQDRIENVLYEKIEKEKDTTALIFYLKTKGKKRGYVEKQQLDVNANVNVQILNIDPIDNINKKDE